MPRLAPLLPLPLLFAAACSDVEGHDHDHDHNHGLATTVVLDLTPSDGGETLRFAWSDPENDGDPVIDDVLLPDASDDEVHAELTYTLEVEVWNDLEDPPEDVTAEIEAQTEEHQLFFTGSAVEGPATGANPEAVVLQAYADEDADGLPVGLSNTLTTAALGQGELVVTLRHLPPENDAPTKTEGLAEDVAEGGFAAIGGDTDIQVVFPLEVQ